MPQMAPLMWTSLFIFFTSMLMLVMIKIWFSSKNSNETNEISETILKQNKMNWKW